MANFLGFDINTATTPKPWGPREQQMVEDQIQTLVLDTITGIKDTSGHKHGKLYNSSSIVKIDTVTSAVITLSGNSQISGDLTITGALNLSSLSISDLIVTNNATINDLDVTTNIDTATIIATGTVLVNDLDVTTNADIGGNADIVGMLYGDIYNLYGDLAIQTRAESYDINFYPDTGGGYDFNLNTTVREFRIHNDTTELFRIHIPILDVEATFYIPVNINSNVNINGDLDVTGTITYGSLTLSGNLAMNSYFINYDGTDNNGISFDASNRLVLNDNVVAGGNYFSFDGGNSGIVLTADYVNFVDPLRFYSSLNAYPTGEGFPFIYSSGTGGAAYPFLSAGNIIIQGRTSANRDILFVNGTTPDIAMIINSSRNVGIGTTAPSEKLHIRGTGSTFMIIESGTDGRTEVLGKNDDETSQWGVGTTDGTNCEFWNYQTGYFRIGTDGTERIRIDSSGKVGINNPSPEVNLDMIGSQFLIANTRTTATTKSGAIIFPHYTSGEENILGLWGYNTNGTNNIYIGGGSGSYNTANKVHIFTGATSSTTGGSERVTIDENGNVGIGVTSPSGTLHVQSSAFTLPSIGTSYDDLILSGNSHIGMSLVSPDLSNTYIQFGSSSTAYGAEFRYNYTDNYLRMRAARSGGHLRFWVNDTTDAMRIDSTGNVGIGTTAPSEKLHIRGTGSTFMIIESGTDGRTEVLGKNDDETSQWGVGTTDGTNCEFWNYQTGYFRIGTDGTERIRIDSSGNIQVFNNVISYDGSSDYGAYLTTTNGFVIRNDSSGDQLTIQEDNGYLEGIGGSVILGGSYRSTSGSTPFATIKGYKSNSTDGNPYGQLRLSTNGSLGITTRMIIDENGLIGIGTTSPATTLNVDGDILFEDAIDADEHMIKIRNTDQGACESSVGAGITFQAYYIPTSSYVLYDLAEIVALRESSSPDTDDGRLIFRTNSGTGLSLKMTLHNDGGLVMSGAGSSHGLGTINATAYYDNDSGPLTDYVFERHYSKKYIPPKNNEPAESFKNRYKICKDTDKFISYIKKNKCFPAFKTDNNDKISIGKRLQKLLETVEVLVYHIDSLNERLKTLEAV